MRITNPRLIYAGLQIQRDVGVEVITLLVCYAGFAIQRDVGVEVITLLVMLKCIRKIFRPFMICNPT